MLSLPIHTLLSISLLYVRSLQSLYQPCSATFTQALKPRTTAFPPHLVANHDPPRNPNGTQMSPEAEAVARAQQAVTRIVNAEWWVKESQDKAEGLYQIVSVRRDQFMSATWLQPLTTAAFAEMQRLNNAASKVWQDKEETIVNAYLIRTEHQGARAMLAQAQTVAEAGNAWEASSAATEAERCADSVEEYVAEIEELMAGIISTAETILGAEVAVWIDRESEVLAAESDDRDMATAAVGHDINDDD